MQLGALDIELQNADAAEEIGAQQQPGRPPGREDDQGKGDPAAPGGHVLRPHGGVDQRHIGPGQTAGHAAEQHGAEADGDDGIADGVGRLM